MRITCSKSSWRSAAQPPKAVPLSLYQIFRRVLLAIAILLLLALAWTGIKGGVDLVPPAQSAWQKVEAVIQVAFGFFALLSAITVFWGRRWWSVTATGFTVMLGVAAGLFSIVWNRTSVASGLVAGTAALVVALAIMWLLRFGARGLTGGSS